MKCEVCEDTGVVMTTITGADYQGEPSEEQYEEECLNCSATSRIYGYDFPLQYDIDYIDKEIDVCKGEKNMIISFDDYLAVAKEIEGSLLADELAKENELC